MTSDLLGLQVIFHFANFELTSNSQGSVVLGHLMDSYNTFVDVFDELSFVFLVSSVWMDFLYHHTVV
jgi:hypothetical protein